MVTDIWYNHVSFFRLKHIFLFFYYIKIYKCRRIYFTFATWGRRGNIDIWCYVSLLRVWNMLVVFHNDLHNRRWCIFLPVTFLNGIDQVNPIIDVYWSARVQKLKNILPQKCRRVLKLYDGCTQMPLDLATVIIIPQLQIVFFHCITLQCIF